MDYYGETDDPDAHASIYATKGLHCEDHADDGDEENEYFYDGDEDEEDDDEEESRDDTKYQIGGPRTPPRRRASTELYFDQVYGLDAESGSMFRRDDVHHLGYGLHGDEYNQSCIGFGTESAITDPMDEYESDSDSDISMTSEVLGQDFSSVCESGEDDDDEWSEVGEEYHYYPTPEPEGSDDGPSAYDVSTLAAAGVPATTSSLAHISDESQLYPAITTVNQPSQPPNPMTEAPDPNSGHQVHGSINLLEVTDGMRDVAVENIRVAASNEGPMNIDRLSDIVQDSIPRLVRADARTLARMFQQSGRLTGVFDDANSKPNPFHC